MQKTTRANKWRAIALPAVDLDSLEAVSQRIGLDFRNCGHVTATDATAKLLRESGMRAVSIVELIDLIVWDAMPNPKRLPISSMPRLNIDADDYQSELKTYGSHLRKWRQDLATRRAAFVIQIDNVLRTYLRNSAADAAVGRLLRLDVQELRRSILFIIQQNFRPTDFGTQDPLLRVACDAWTHLELQIPEVTNVRRDLWDFPTALSDPQSKEERSLKDRVEAALSQVFGPVDGHRQIMFHGFYFFTPAQWGLWQLLRSHEDIDQCFIVHDDGSNRAFESWRHYFIERWLMPRVEYQPFSITGVGGAESLRSSLEGRCVDDVDLRHVKVVKFNNTTEFVRHWSLEQAEAKEQRRDEPVLYAPSPADLARVIDRVGLGQTATSVNLANLPVGQFLLALHECVEFNVAGVPELILNGDRLMDMAASGFLDTDDVKAQPSRHLSALRRALPFFDDVRFVDDWSQRAVALQRLVIGEVAAFGPRSSGQTDLQRVAGAAANELRLASWCDLTDVEVHNVVAAIRAAEQLIREIVADGPRKLDRYFDYVLKSLERAMASLNDEDRSVVQQKLAVVGATAGQDLDAEGVKDVIFFILGREMDFGFEDDVARSEESKVINVRFIDALGLQKSPSDVHIANLSETMFPAKTPPYGWPFSERSLKHHPDRLVAAEIQRTRGQTAQLGDLYLFWLALEGLQSGRTLTLSWISRLGNELQNPSSLLTLITRPAVRNDNVVVLTGGAQLSPANRGIPVNAQRPPLPSRPVNSQVAMQGAAAALAQLDRIAASSAIACSRRFVLQWALGPSASFTPSHMQTMLYGNMIGVMQLRGRLQRASDAIQKLASDLWRHLTPGERRSSLEKRRIVSNGPTPRWQWVHTLKGNRQGTSAVDRAYQASFDPAVVIPVGSVVGSDIDAVIPPRPENVTSEMCNMCPVAPRCLARTYEREQ